MLDWREKYLNKITCGDCLGLMKDLPDNSIDLVVTDPPYGLNIAKNGYIGGSKLANVKNYGVCDWDSKIPSPKIFRQIFRISNNQIIFGGNYFVTYLVNSPCWIVWDKDNRKSNFADCELAWTSFDSAVRKYVFRWNGMLQEKMGKQKEERFHPTQKPVELLKQIIRDYSKPTDLIFDPFLGSGTTAIAAYQLERDFIGFEINSDYCAISQKRLDAVRNQGDLFRTKNA